MSMSSVPFAREPHFNLMPANPLPHVLPLLSTPTAGGGGAAAAVHRVPGEKGALLAPAGGAAGDRRNAQPSAAAGAAAGRRAAAGEVAMCLSSAFQQRLAVVVVVVVVVVRDSIMMESGVGAGALSAALPSQCPPICCCVRHPPISRGRRAHRRCLLATVLEPSDTFWLGVLSRPHHNSASIRVAVLGWLGVEEALAMTLPAGCQNSSRHHELTTSEPLVLLAGHPGVIGTKQVLPALLRPCRHAPGCQALFQD